MKSKIVLVIFLLFVANFTSMALKNQKIKNSHQPWLEALIAKGSYGKSPISEIKSYIYNDKLVYLISYDSGCCDQYSAVLKNQNGETICHPFGGISGKGDMQCTDFIRAKIDEKMIWFNESPKTNPEKKDRSFKMEKSEI